MATLLAHIGTEPGADGRFEEPARSLLAGTHVDHSAPMPPWWAEMRR